MHHQKECKDPCRKRLQTWRFNWGSYNFKILFTFSCWPLNPFWGPSIGLGVMVWNIVTYTCIVVHRFLTRILKKKFSASKYCMLTIRLFIYSPHLKTCGPWIYNLGYGRFNPNICRSREDDLSSFFAHLVTYMRPWVLLCSRFHNRDSSYPKDDWN